MQNPIRGFLHGGAAIASLAGNGHSAHPRLGQDNGNRRGSRVRVGVMLAMYTVSSLYHSIPWSERWKVRLQRLDHSMIYLMVAGTFTPIAIAALEGTSLAIGLGLVWTIALTGILLKTFMPGVKTWLSVTLQLSMGWVAVFWMPRIVDRLGFGAVALILAGGLLYTVGAVFFMTKRPRLLPRHFSYHELFHVLVVAASVFHFMAILIYAIPATA